MGLHRGRRCPAVGHRAPGLVSLSSVRSASYDVAVATVVHGDFEWDADKAESNLAKHGVSFNRARLVFSDPLGIAAFDDREDYGESRFARVGMVEDALLFVAYTERGDRIRIISARRATKDEQDDYYQENGQVP